MALQGTKRDEVQHKRQGESTQATGRWCPNLTRPLKFGMLLCIFVVVVASNKSFKFHVETHAVAKGGLGYFIRKEVPVSHYTVNYEQLKILGVSNLRSDIPISVPRFAVSLKVVRDGVNDFNIQIRRLWNFVISAYRNDRTSLLDNPCCRLSLITAYTAHIERPKMALRLSSIARCNFANYSCYGNFFKINHDPGPFAFDGSIGLFLNGAKSAERGDDTADAYQRKDNGANERDSISCGTWWETHDPYGPLILAAFDGSAVLIGGLLGGIFFCLRRGRWRRLGWAFVGLGLLLCGIGSFLAGWGWLWGSYQTDSPRCKEQSSHFHGSLIVPHKYLLTSITYWGTVIAIRSLAMAHVLSTDKQVAVISALAEGSGIRQIERIMGVHRDTIMRLGVRVGEGCASLLDRKMRDLTCGHLQFDEIWGFIGKKERHCTVDDDPTVGDVWTFCAIDSDTKLVPSFRVGKRDAATANAFVADVARRLKNRPQVSSDALRAYVEAVERAFGANVDFAQIVKTYVHEDAQNAERKYSAPEFVIEEKKAIAGFPDMRLASTSHIERLNGTTRLHMRRLTRLTYAFSKKRENFVAAVALHFAYYNFVKRHNTLRCTPAMAAGIERDFWTVGDLVEAAA